MVRWSSLTKPWAAIVTARPMTRATAFPHLSMTLFDGKKPRESRHGSSSSDRWNDDLASFLILTLISPRAFSGS
jgi:hypothetical protein